MRLLIAISSMFCGIACYQAAMRGELAAAAIFGIIAIGGGISALTWKQ